MDWFLYDKDLRHVTVETPSIIDLWQGPKYTSAKILSS